MGTHDNRLKEALEALTGQDAPLKPALPDEIAVPIVNGEAPLGYSQLNELLLLYGFDRVNQAFFQYLVNDTVDYVPGSSMTFDLLTAGIERFQKLGLLVFGNVKFAFKRLSRRPDELRQHLGNLRERKPVPRHEPARPLVPIDAAETYFLGYAIEDDIKRRLRLNPEDPAALEDQCRRASVVDRGKKNHEAYLASDHLDVYVATSMRERHEYFYVNRVAHDIFSDPRVASLKLRWFDPTQAYCPDRIDKGLAEALMLKRAKCTLYLAQESDTLGKDSELASTLAQGKPVIAFVPDHPSGYVDDLISGLAATYPDEDERSLVLQQLRGFAPDAAWNDAKVRGWLDNPGSYDRQAGRQLLEQKLRAHYDKRASMLQDVHPLGIQVHLTTGVANGVLVVRRIKDCTELIRRVVCKEMSFRLEKKEHEGRRYLLLKEEISNCVFRVMTGDMMLMNAFWNFYLRAND
jgi:hypothetical protein